MEHCLMLARCLFVIAVLAVPALADAQEKTLADRLTPLIKAHHGKVALAVLHLDNGVSYDYDGDEVMPTASMIKFMIMLEVYQQVAEGKVKLSDPVVLHEKDKVPGSGILTYHFSDGAAFPLRDAVRLMIAHSDNTATNLVLDRIGIDSTNRRMAQWDCSDCRINAKVYLGSKTSVDPVRTKKYGLGSATPKQTVKLLAKLYRGECGDKQATKEMIEHLKKCEYKDALRRFLPPSVSVANKTGSVSDAKTDAGILYFPGGPVAMCVMTAQNRDKRFAQDNEASILIGRIAEQVYLHYVKTPAKK